MEKIYDDMISEINENLEYLEKSNKLISNINKYLDFSNEIENLEMESEDDA